MTNNHELAERLTLLRNHGRIGNYNHVMLGTNTRLDETQAAVLNIKLPFLDTWNRRRRKHALTYTDKIMGAGLTVSFPKEYDVEQTSVYHQYVIRLNDKHIRDALRTYLISRGVDAKIHYPVPLHRTPAYQFMNYGTGTFPVAESLCDTILSLPMYPQLTDEDITYVVAVMKEFFEYCKDVTITPFVMFPDILIKRGYTPIHIYSKGGSSAKVFLALSPYNEKVVIKYCDWDGISGNGIPWLISQAKKLKMIQETWPDDLSIYYSRIRELYYDGNVAFYAMEYHEGAQDITEYFFNPEVTEDDMIQNIDNIIKVLVNTHYKRHIEAYPNEIEKNFVVREKHRMELLVQHNGKVYEHLLKGRPFKFSGMYEKDATYFFEKLMQQELIVINGRILPNLPALMKIFEEKVEYFQEKYGPTHHSQYAHGDLPLRNIFRMQDGSIRITDVRSNNGDVTSPNKFSVEFDIGKIAHSFLLELVRNRHYEFSGSRDNGIYVFNYRFHDLPEIRKFRNVWRKFPDIVRNNTALLELFECSSTDWMKHIMLAESINYACDVIHRFSNDPSGHDSLIYYLYATEALYAFLESEELEPHVRQDSDYTWWTQSVQRVEATPS